MLDYNMLFKIGGIGIVLLILEKVLKSSGKDDVATMTNIAGIVIILIMIITMIAKLFDSVKTMFMF
ncbi:stage III sporulation protein AC [Clostridium sp.]|uniref:stage III sporulation protein AC n=1 Tax=Clostridium sp. TaxID=1506 RepID=UPI0034648ABA